MSVALVSLFSTRSFGVRILEACLAEKGIPVTTVYFKEATLEGMPPFRGDELETLGRLITSHKPDLIGISLRSSFYHHATALTAHLRRISKAPIMWGGTHAIMCPDLCISHADIVCIGEGESTIVEVHDRIQNGESIHNVNNIYCKNGDAVIKNPLSPLTEDLEAVPKPIIGLRENVNKIFFDGRKVFYEDPLIATHSTFYDFIGARGCPYKCSYCSNSHLQEYFKGKGPYIRQRSVDSVMRELLEAKSRLPNLRRVGAQDEIFGMNETWVNEFCERYKAEIDLPFHCDMHPSFIRESVIGKLKSIGLQTITIGMQSSLERVRRERYGRNTPDSVLFQKLQILHDHGLKVYYDFIFDDPLAEPCEIQYTLDWLLKRPRPFYVAMYSMQHHPRTAYTNRLLKEGVISEEQIDGLDDKGLFEWRVSFKTGISRSADEKRHLKIIGFLNDVVIPLTGGKAITLSIPSPIIQFLAAAYRTSVLRILAGIAIDILHAIPITLNNFLSGLKKFVRKLTA